MPDLFLSYAREDRATVQQFADELQREGFEVWWDRSLKPGEAFDQAIERALEEARAVIVLWSKASVNSRWVRAEATQAQASQRLVPVIIEPCKRPIIFELTHTVDLTGWAGDPDDPRWRSFVAGLRRSSDGEDNPAGVVAKGGTARAQPASGGFSRRTHAMGVRRPALAAVASLLVLGGAGAWWYHASHGSQAAVPGAAPAASVAAAPVTLAVLPFKDMSPGHDQGYFADGVTEEILNTLAAVGTDLNVTARTSAFYFKDRDDDVKVIGQKLGVAHVLEGSVRRAGNQLRITAQLIDTRPGFHRWSKTYDRPLGDVFQIQEEIARAVTDELQISLGVGALAHRQGMTHNLEAYDAYLAGVALKRAGSADSTSRAADLLQHAVALDPNFLWAWLDLEDAYPDLMASQNDASERVVLQGRLDEAVRQATRLGPGVPEVFEAIGERHAVRGEWSEAAQQFRAEVAAKARQGIHAGRPPAFLRAVGRTQEAITVLEHLRSTDPLNPDWIWFIVEAYANAGDYAAAVAVAERNPDPVDKSTVLNQFVLTAALGAGDRVRVPHELDELIATSDSEDVRQFWLRMKQGQTHPAEALAYLHSQLAHRDAPAYALISVAMWLAYFGDPRSALEALRTPGVRTDPYFLASTLWLRVMRDARRLPEFKDLVRDLKLPEYWRDFGWGDYCHPVGKDDFECN